MKKRKSHPLVIGFLERISSKAFEEFPRQITELIGRQHGIYSLYKGDHLYYVGLATNLRNRIKHHLKDRHAGKWDRFSLYLVHKVDHIRELESLLLRIADPKGNRTGGRLRRAEDLRKQLLRKIEEEQYRQIGVVLGPDRRTKNRHKTPRKGKLPKGAPTLAKYVSSRFMIKRKYKGKMYTAWVLTDGTIQMGGKVFNAPSTAGYEIIKKPVDGWHFWKFKNPQGEWVPLDKLRKR